MPALWRSLVAPASARWAGSAEKKASITEIRGTAPRR